MTFVLQAMIFLLASAAIAWISRASLRSRSFHGFYRFFAWEEILALILLNLDRWFVRPLSLHQLISWLLLVVSLFLAVHGFRLLHLLGKPDEQRSDPALISLEKTTELVTAGAYRYIRHPLYSSLLFLALGAFFKAPSWPGGALAVAATIFLALTARQEEAENLRYFGPAYADYVKETKRFIPFVF